MGHSATECPVCKQEFKTTTDRIDHHLIEEDGACPCGTYSYNYWAGHTREEIGPFTLLSSYNWTPENYGRAYRQAVWITRTMRFLRLWPIYVKVSRLVNNIHWWWIDRQESKAPDGGTDGDYEF